MPPRIAERARRLTGHIVAHVVECLFALLRPDQEHR